MNLTVDYLGLKLAHPIIPGAAPWCDNLDKVRELEDAGAPALVMHSLFQEQLPPDIIWGLNGQHQEEAGGFSYSNTYTGDFRLNADEYLEQIQRLKAAVGIPIIASLNGVGSEALLDYAHSIESAGADALELNYYILSMGPMMLGSEVEAQLYDTVSRLKQSLKIPVVVKLTPYFSSLPEVAEKLDKLGADGLVLFNRFFTPEIDVSSREVLPRIELSHAQDLGLRLWWTAVLAGQIRGSVAVSGGIYNPKHVIKAIMVGATVVQTVSALLRFGPEYLKTLVEGLQAFGDKEGYASLNDMRGSLSMHYRADLEPSERAHYLRALQLWQE